MQTFASLILLATSLSSIMTSNLVAPPEPVSRVLGVATDIVSTPSHPAEFFDHDVIVPAIESHPASNQPANIYGGIVPHHTAASELIADHFARLAPQNPDTVFIIGPNHDQVGRSNALSTDWDWETPYGKVTTNAHLVSRLEAKQLVEVDNPLLTKEHSVAAIMPFVSYYLPESQVVPLVLKSTITNQELDALANHLTTLSTQKNIAIVAAVDFSHYLNADDAQRNDDYTRTLLQNADWRTLRTLSSDYTDSPESLALLIKVMDNQGARIQITANTNSGLMIGDSVTPTTSYFQAQYLK